MPADRIRRGKHHLPLARRGLCGYCSRSSPTQGRAADTTSPGGRAFPPSTHAGDQPVGFVLLCRCAPSQRGHRLWRGTHQHIAIRGESPPGLGGRSTAMSYGPASHRGSAAPYCPAPAGAITLTDPFMLTKREGMCQILRVALMGWRPSRQQRRGRGGHHVRQHENRGPPPGPIRRWYPARRRTRLLRGRKGACTSGTALLRPTAAGGTTCRRARSAPSTS